MSAPLQAGGHGPERTVAVARNLIEDACANQAACEGVVDAYLDGELGVHLRIRGNVERKVHDHIAVYEALMRNDFEVGGGVDEDAIDKELGNVVRRDDRRGVHDPMPVLPRKLMEQPEAWVPSVVRLYRLDGEPVLLGQFLDAVLAPERLGILEDREFDRLWDEFALKRRIDPERVQSELVGGVVERSSLVVKERPEEPRKLHELFGLDLRLDKPMPCGLPPVAVALNVHGVRARVVEPFAQLTKGFSILIRPVDALPRVVEGVDGSFPDANVYPWREMPDKPKDQQETEQTPKGLTVPVPKRNEFFGNLKKIAKSQGPAPKPQQSGMRGKGSRRPPPHHNTRSK
jgi:hypothetical protein